jgi:nucleotide-binding universal stress UspA family protein
MLVLMAVVTTFITSPVLKLLFPAEELVALKAGANSVLTTPSLAVLTCVSHPDSVMGLARMTALLCHGTDARAYALRLSSVEENASLFPENHPTEEEDVAQLASRLARGWGVQIQAMSFPSANPARDICEVARIKKVDIILMGAHRALLGSGPLGGTVSEIVNRGDADVVMLLDLGLKAVHRVLFAKGGPHAAAAARLVARLARLPDIIITELEPVSRGNAVELLLTKAVGQDLIITGFEGIWMTTLSSSHLDKGRKFQELSCSLLAVHGAE